MPTQVDQQPHDEQRTEPRSATAVRGSEDEAIAAFNQRRKSEARTEHDEPADEPQDDPAPEARDEPEEADPEPEDEPGEELVEVKFEGRTYSVPPELREALLRKSDYSRSMNALSAKEKDYAQRIESAEKLIESAGKLAEAKAQLRAIDGQLEQFKAVDFDKLEMEDPARASVLAVRLLRLQQARESALRSEQSIADEVASERSKKHAADQADMVKALEEQFPGGWGDEAGARVSQYALKAGWKPEEVRAFTDSRLVLLLEKARKFDAIQDGKRAALASGREAQPVAKPGAPRRADPVRDAASRFQRSHSDEDAAALFEARAGTKGRR